MPNENELVPVQSNGAELYRVSTDAANICKDIVVATAKVIGQRKYVQVEGWQAIAVAHGCAASSTNVERIPGGFRATGEVRRMSDGHLIAQAEGFVGEDEPTWFGGTTKRWKWGEKRGEKIWYEDVLPKRADYAIRAMAQTRAISRACRSAFAHVVVMMNADLATTPAEEVPDGGFDGHDTPQVIEQPTSTAEDVEKLKLADDAKKYVDEIELCDTSEKLEKVVMRHAVLMGSLVSKLPKWHARIVEILTKKREDFSKLQEAAE